MNMIPLLLTSYLPAQSEANGFGQDTPETDAQTDDFSTLLASFFSLPAPMPQPDQQLPAEAQSAEAKVIEAALPECSSPTLPMTFLTQTGFQDSEKAGDAGLRLNGILEKLQQVAEKPLVEPPVVLRPNGIRLTENTDATGFAIQPAQTEVTQLQVTEATQLQITEVTQAQNTGVTQAMQNTEVTQFQNIEVTQFQIQYPGRHPVPPQIEPTPIHPKLINPPKAEVRLFDYAPPEILSQEPEANAASPAATAFQILQSEGKAVAETTPRAGILEPPPQFRDPVVRFPTLKRDSIDQTIEPLAETAETLSRDSNSSTQATPTFNPPAASTTATNAADATLQNITAQIVRTVAAASEVSVRHEARSIRLRLHPEELGEVRINISTDASGRLSAQISADHDLTRRAIAGGLDHLRQTLEQAGVNLDRLDLGSSQSASAGPGAQTNTGSRNEALPAGSASHNSPPPDISTSDGKSSAEEERLLSLRA